MVLCPACGKENEGDANFCIKCGAAVRGAGPGYAERKFERRVEEFASDMERFGKDAARRAEEFTRGLLRDMDKAFSGTSVCPECGTSFPGVHDYCARCGSRIG